MTWIHKIIKYKFISPLVRNVANRSSSLTVCAFILKSATSFCFRCVRHLQLDAAVAAPRAESGGKLSGRAARVVLTVGQSADEQQEAERREAAPVPATFPQLSLAALPNTRQD